MDTKFTTEIILFIRKIKLCEFNTPIYYFQNNIQRHPVKFEAERRNAGGVLVRERGFFLVLTGMPRPVLGESCTTSIKDFATFPPHQKKKKK